MDKMAVSIKWERSRYTLRLNNRLLRDYSPAGLKKAREAADDIAQALQFAGAEVMVDIDVEKLMKRREWTTFK